MDWHFNYWNPKNTKNYIKFVVASYKLINIKSCESSLNLLQLVHNKNAIYNYPCPGLEHVSSPWTWYQAFSWSKDFLENQTKKGILCLENWTWSSPSIPSCKCCGKEEEKLAFPSVFFQHLKCRPEAIVSRQENWMIGITVQLQPVWDPTAAFGYLAEFLISQSRLAARRSCRFFFFFYAMDLKLVATAVILTSGYLGVH